MPPARVRRAAPEPDTAGGADAGLGDDGALPELLPLWCRCDCIRCGDCCPSPRLGAALDGGVGDIMDCGAAVPPPPGPSGEAPCGWYPGLNREVNDPDSAGDDAAEPPEPPEYTEPAPPPELAGEALECGVPMPEVAGEVLLSAAPAPPGRRSSATVDESAALVVTVGLARSLSASTMPEPQRLAPCMPSISSTCMVMLASTLSCSA